MKHILSITLLILLLRECFCQDALDQSLRSYLNQIENIKTSHVNIQLDINEHKSDSPVTKLVMTIWKTPDSYRLDKETKKHNLSERSIVCDNCEQPGHTLLESSKKSTVTLLSPNPNQAKSLQPMTTGIDLALLGATFHKYPSLQNPTNNKYHQRLYPILNDPEYQNFKLASSDNDIKTYTATNIRLNMNVTIKISISLNNAITSIEGNLNSVDGKVRYKLVITNSNHKLVTDTLYLPGQVLHQRFEDGKLIYSEKHIINVHSVNQPIDPKVFTVATMNFQNGKSVYKSGKPTESYVVWDGKIVPAESIPSLQDDIRKKVPPPSLPKPSKPEVVGSSSRWYYVAAAVLFSGIAVYFLRRFLQRG